MIFFIRNNYKNGPELVIDFDMQDVRETGNGKFTMVLKKEKLRRLSAAVRNVLERKR